ncbi:hypothetical protein MSHOH_0867 [Methanosarcina horonobensis HB-1 = JCM 15518]|uniref:Uncharacterized protein n=1 Tax=Methanosarcina horonobensis HB-1 = JCM 15518 TaxID=1434110 RepID=A0A0E3WV79_9EURY|nr:hypothetical protein MSHOH_0867 [Methanosarcina horonobensis HB-1 = JCM 15518]
MRKNIIPLAAGFIATVIVGYIVKPVKRRIAQKHCYNLLRGSFFIEGYLRTPVRHFSTSLLGSRQYFPIRLSSQSTRPPCQCFCRCVPTDSSRQSLGLPIFAITGRLAPVRHVIRDFSSLNRHPSLVRTATASKTPPATKCDCSDLGSLSSSAHRCIAVILARR